MMKLSSTQSSLLLLLLCLLTTTTGLASAKLLSSDVVVSSPKMEEQDATTTAGAADGTTTTTAATIRQPPPYLRRLEDFGVFTEAPSTSSAAEDAAAWNETSTTPSTAPDRGEETAGDNEEGTGGETEDIGGENDATTMPQGDIPERGDGDEDFPTESPRSSGGDDDMDESPSATGEESSPAASPSAMAGEGELPTFPEGYPTPSPSVEERDYDERTEYPTAGRPTYEDDVPTYNDIPSSPTAGGEDYPFSSPSYVPPTPKPYFSNDDEGDPILFPTSDEGSGGSSTGSSTGSSSNDGAYSWNNSSIEDLEHDKTVMIALLVTFGIMFLFSVVVAHQMLENPHGCCASLCRITVACCCGLLRFFCYPCRSMFGCTGQPKRDHMIVPDDMGTYTHDLELS